MRPLKLTMSAFGPYAGVTEINMDSLGESGLYLITGDTGAGKTTIFDGICYALFGEASGKNREKSMLRSKYAKDETPTFVELAFIHQGKKYLVKRKLAKDLTSVSLNMPDGGVITKVKEVAKEINDILGVDREQFAQIAMLSQGEFLKLLIADTAERQKIFRNLFNTSNYEEFEKMLEYERKDLEQQCDKLRSNVNQYIGDIECDEDAPLSIDVEKAHTGSLTIEETMILINKLLEIDRESEKKSEELIKEVDSELEKLNIEIGKAGEIDKLRRQLSENTDELNNLYQLREQIESRLTQAKSELDKKEEIISKIESIKSVLPNYQKHDDLATSIADNRKKLDTLRDDIAKKTTEKEKKESEISLLKDEQQSLSGTGEKKIILANDLEKSDKRIAVIEKLKSEKAELDKKIIEHKKALENYRQADEEYRRLNNEYQQMDQIFRDSIAGILAKGLVEGKPCPVCGSIEHPSLAILSEEVPNKETVDEAKNLAEAAHEKVDELSKKANSAGSDVEMATKDLIDDASEIVKLSGIEDFEAIVSDLLSEEMNIRVEIAGKLKQEEINFARLEKLNILIPGIEENIRNLTEGLNTANVTAEGLNVTIEQEEKQLSAISVSLEYSSRENAEKFIESLRETLQKIESDYKNADEKYREHIGQINGLERSIHDYKESLSAAKEYAIDKLEEQVEELSERKNQLHAKKTDIVSRKNKNLNAINGITQKSAELSELEDKLSYVTSLAKTASGNLTGKKKITLEAYVQGTYFDRIIERANVRLFTMTDAQYELIRLKEVDSLKGKSGLELGVIDHYNGSIRSVKTLSGGEGFMASLSLALGLSDEIQSSSGGVHIDTLFVDEGFGSLDSETLNLAYKALVSLTDGNRLVGIISHVTELKEKIDKQIVVKKEKSGGSFAKIVL